MYRLLIVAPMLITLPALAHAAPPGSYRRSCTDISTNGPFLNATCSGSGGRQFDTTLDTSQCRGGDIGNSFGRLVCGSVQGSATQLRGSGDDDQQYGQRRQRRYDPDDADDQGQRRGYGYRYRNDDDEQDGYAPPRRRPRYYDPDQE